MTFSSPFHSDKSLGKKRSLVLPESSESFIVRTLDYLEWVNQ